LPCEFVLWGAKLGVVLCDIEIGVHEEAVHLLGQVAALEELVRGGGDAEHLGELNEPQDKAFLIIVLGPIGEEVIEGGDELIEVFPQLLWLG
jgi:hypothetical protein